MSTHMILSIKETRKDIPIMPLDLALLSTLTGSNCLCLELIFMVPKVFEPLKFYSTVFTSFLAKTLSKFREILSNSTKH